MREKSPHVPRIQASATIATTRIVSPGMTTDLAGTIPRGKVTTMVETTVVIAASMMIKAVAAAGLDLPQPMADMNMNHIVAEVLVPTAARRVMLTASIFPGAMEVRCPMSNCCCFKNLVENSLHG